MFFQVRFQFCTISFVCHEKYPDVLLFTSSVLQVFRHFPLFETPIMQFSSGHPPFLLLPSYLPILKGSEPYRPPRRLNPPRKKEQAERSLRSASPVSILISHVPLPAQRHFFSAWAIWSGQEVDFMPQRIPSMRLMASSTFIPSSSAEMPWRLP